MRRKIIAAAVGALMVAGCGSSEAEGEPAAGGEALTGAEIASEAEGMVQPRPGQYRAALEMLEFDVPGMPEAATQQMRQAFAANSATANTFCMTEADVAENGPEQMVKNLAQADCEMRTFDVSGGSIEAELQCPGQGGGSSQVRMAGDMTTEGSTMTMDMSQDIAGVGAMKMKMRVVSERIGECAA